MLRFPLLCLVFLLFFAATPAVAATPSSLAEAPLVHPLKMTVAKLELREDRSAELRIRFFLDDLTDQIERQYSLSGATFTSPDAEGTRALNNYLRDHLQLIANNQVINFTITGASSADSDGLIIEFQLNSTAKVPTEGHMWLKNSVFTDFFPQQVNQVLYDGEVYRFNIRDKNLKLHG